jgi:RNA polymerase sigma-70 factor (ECF subfamily)
MGGDDRSKSLPVTNDVTATEDPGSPALLQAVVSVEAGSRRSAESPPRPGVLAATLADARAERLRRLVHEHEPVVRALAQKLCRSHFDADDLTQDVFERAVRHVDTLSGMSERAWLCTVTRNLFVDRLRRGRAAVLTSESEARDQPAPPLDEPLPPWRTLEPDQLRRAVSLLGAKLREVYVMHAFEGIDYTTIAARLSIPKATVGTRLLLARQKLKQLLLADSGGGS